MNPSLSVGRSERSVGLSGRTLLKTDTLHPGAARTVQVGSLRSILLAHRAAPRQLECPLVGATVDVAQVARVAVVGYGGAGLARLARLRGGASHGSRMSAASTIIRARIVASRERVEKEAEQGGSRRIRGLRVEEEQEGGKSTRRLGARQPCNVGVTESSSLSQHYKRLPSGVTRPVPCSLSQTDEDLRAGAGVEGSCTGSSRCESSVER